MFGVSQVVLSSPCFDLYWQRISPGRLLIISLHGQGRQTSLSHSRTYIACLFRVDCNGMGRFEAKVKGVVIISPSKQIREPVFVGSKNTLHSRHLETLAVRLSVTLLCVCKAALSVLSSQRKGGSSATRTVGDAQYTPWAFTRRSRAASGFGSPCCRRFMSMASVRRTLSFPTAVLPLISPSLIQGSTIRGNWVRLVSGLRA